MLKTKTRLICSKGACTALAQMRVTRFDKKSIFELSMVQARLYGHIFRFTHLVVWLALILTFFVSFSRLIIYCILYFRYKKYTSIFISLSVSAYNSTYTRNYCSRERAGHDKQLPNRSCQYLPLKEKNGSNNSLRYQNDSLQTAIDKTLAK